MLCPILGDEDKNLRCFIFNLADFYDQYLINPLVGEFVRKIFPPDLCEDQMKIMMLETSVNLLMLVLEQTLV